MTAGVEVLSWGCAGTREGEHSRKVIEQFWCVGLYMAPWQTCLGRTRWFADHSEMWKETGGRIQLLPCRVSVVPWPAHNSLGG